MSKRPCQHIEDSYNLMLREVHRMFRLLQWTLLTGIFSPLAGPVGVADIVNSVRFMAAEPCPVLLAPCAAFPVMLHFCDVPCATLPPVG